MTTYSVNELTPITEAISYKISGSPSFFDQIINTLIDNDDKMISPHEIRDVMISLWDDVIFKQTVATGATGFTDEYIGIDNGNPNEKDLKRKFLLGKRAFSGTYSYVDSHDIMGFSNSVLLTSDYDSFIWNTKNDNFEQFETKVKILSGTNFDGFSSMPTIETQYVSDTNSLSLNFINPNGDIDIRSSSGTVSVAQITFPSISESTASASTGNVLKINSSNNQLYWDDIVFPQLSTIGNTGSELTIFGDPTLINGYPLEFSDSRWSPLQFGDIQFGDTFSNVSLSEILKRMIYQYLPPSCSIQLTEPYMSGYVEVGTSPMPTLEYEINKKTLDLNVTTLTNMIPGIYSPISSNEYINVFSSSEGIVISPITASTTKFTITVNDGTSVVSASTSITGVYPYFYGFSSLGQMTVAGLNSLTKVIEPKNNKLIDFSGTGSLYFIYPKIYGTLSNIYDDIGNDYLLSGTFSGPSTKVFNSPSGFWSSTEYYIYQWDNAIVGPPSVNYQFVY
jgi:hypothetical protein